MDAVTDGQIVQMPREVNPEIRTVVGLNPLDGPAPGRSPKLEYGLLRT